MLSKLYRTKRMATLAIVALTLSFQSFTTKKDKMRIKSQQTAPAFTVKDVNGKTVNLSDYKGKKVLITFYRNVGCPVCNVRFHELQEQAEFYKSKDLIVLAIYESSAENMKKFLVGENPYATMIPNPEQNLYSMYRIESGMGKVMKGMLHGAMGKMKKGKALFKTKIKQDGNKSTIGADFLIDEKGVVNTAYYGKYVGDHLPLSAIKQFLN
jgi:thioredoxin-dependent peroxiredoxin